MATIPRRWKRKKDRPLPLFEPPPRRVAVTSQAAAASVAKHMPAMRARVLAYLRQRGSFGSTREEAAVSLAMLIQTICPLFRELADAGLIRPAGRTRETRSGRNAGVMIATGQGGQD